MTDTTVRGACPDGACAATPRLDLSNINFLGLPFPTTIDPGEKLPIVVVMQNTGAQAWTNGPLNQVIRLYSTHEPRTFWTNSYDDMNSTTPVGATHAFNFTMTGPFTTGTFPFVYRLRDSTLPGGFDSNFVTSITVQEQQRAYECQLVSHNVPPRIGVGRAVSASFTVRNIGYAPWAAGTTFRLCQNDGGAFQGPNCVNTPAGGVAPGATTTYTMPILGPSVPGTYTLVRELTDYRLNGIGRFNDFALLSCINLDVIAQLCGDNFPGNDPTEECDDGNTINGDGCSETCQIENPRVVDLANSAADRTIFGRSANKALANVVFGDVFAGDSVLDVCVGDTDHVFVPNTTPPLSRNTAGRVTCYDGNNFFGGPDMVAPNGAAFDVIGASRGDHLGGSSSGRIVIGDVTADGSVDLILSSPFADGPGELRTDCGEAYVIMSAEFLTGTLDMSNVGTASVATIIGAAAGDNLRALTFGDMDDDGTRDLIVSGANNDAAGADAGTIYVISGTDLVPGAVIDLATYTPFATILGPAPGALLGFVAAVGDVAGSVTRDLVVSAQAADFSGRVGAGIVWVFTGPMAGGTYDLNTQFDLRIGGAEFVQRAGSSLAIGNVRGNDTRQDLVIGIPGATRANGDRIGRVDVFQGPIAIPPSRTIDLLTDVASTRIWGTDDDDRAGSAIALGHWNNDHRLDIAISASSADGPANNRDGAGEMVLVLGHENMQSEWFLNRTSFFRVYGADPRDLMGAHVLSLAFSADLDGGQSVRSYDVCVGSYRGNTLAEGRVDCFASPF